MKWEYLVVRVRDDYPLGIQGEKETGHFYEPHSGPTIPDLLCELGRDDWDAMGSLPTFDDPNDYHILMKRPLKEESPYEAPTLPEEQLKKLLETVN